MRHVGIHEKPAAEIFEHYLEALDRGDTFSFEKDLWTWMNNTTNTIMYMELRRIWYRIIDKDIEGAKTMILELQESYIDNYEVQNTTLLNFFDRRLKEKGY